MARLPSNCTWFVFSACALRFAHTRLTPSQHLQHWLLDFIESHITGSMKQCLGGGRPLYSVMGPHWRRYRLTYQWLCRACNSVDKNAPYPSPPIPAPNQPAAAPNPYAARRMDKMALYLFEQTVLAGVNAVGMIDSIASAYSAMRSPTNTTDVPCLVDAVDVFVMLARKNGVLAPDSAYKQHLEPRLVADAAALFAEKSAEWLCTMSTRDYLLAARALLHEETARATRVLHSSSLRPLLDAFDEYMLRRPLKELMQSGTVAAAIDAFVHSDGDAQVAAAAALEELRLAYEMISRLGNEGAVCFARVLYDRARNDGSLVIDMAHADDAIVQLVKLHRKYNSLVTLLAERAYTKQAPLHEAVVAAFKATMEHKIRDSTNTSAVPSVEVLATTVDTVIRKADAAQQWNLGSVEECCNGFVALLDHAPDKDHFHDEHRRHMTRRLLEADANMETEQLFLGMLKAVLGGNYAAKLATMFTDHEQAGATNKNFHAWAAGALPLPDFKVTVLTAGSWPLSPSPGGLVLPPLLQECMAAFASFYKTVTTNRTLSWVHESSRACLAYRHPSRPRPCELRMSALQALVCLAMPTTSEPCTVSELARRTGMANDELRRAVMGLSAGKSSTAVLNRTSSSGNLKKVDMADQLVLNDTFNPPKIVVTVPLPKVTVVKRDAKTGVAEICIHSRRYVCDAALVRVMKSRKTMAMAELTAEVIQQITQFRADPKMIKERIEDLMQREFLNRDEQNVHVLHYVA